MAAQPRKIIHIDMDAFFASVEQRDQPELRGRPVIVGGQPDSRGVVAACSYEARRFGIHSAMPASRAYRLCPEAVFIKPRFTAYREVSDQIHQVFKRYTDLVEPLSLDEAYLDVSKTPDYQGSATLIARAIKQQIKEETGLTASAGVSYNKFLAKIASDMDKPDGLYLITPEQGLDFIRQLPIGKFYGIGRATENKMQSLGIMNGADLGLWSEADLVERFGKAGRYYYSIAQGIDERPVRNSRVRKSLGREHTYARDLCSRNEIKDSLRVIEDELKKLMLEKKLSGQTLTLKVKYEDFEQVTRSQTQAETITPSTQLDTVIDSLLEKTEVGERAVRLLGLTLSSLHPLSGEQTNQPVSQLGLFQSSED